MNQKKWKIIRKEDGYHLLTDTKITATEAVAVIEEQERRNKIKEWHEEEARVGLI